MAEQQREAGRERIDLNDKAACERYLNYALQLSPKMRSERMWSRLKWKRRLGPRVWGLLAPLVERFRGKASASRPQP